MTYPDQSTAFLIIHGMGEQDPFYALDNFVRTFHRVLEQDNKIKIDIKHQIEKRKNWIENYISLNAKKTPHVNLDFYEYYWAYIPQRKIKLDEIFKWLIKTSHGASTFYKENIELIKKYENDLFKKGKFPKNWYFKNLNVFIRILRLIKIPKIPFLDKILRMFMRKGEKIFVNFIGDVAIYTSTDIKSRTYKIRRDILDGAVQSLKNLLLNEKYSDIIIAGHSLGSVIGYDAINRVNNEMSFDPHLKKTAKKLKGLVTFGSPLDKIAFFFREHTGDEEIIRRQILANHHNFKNLNLNLRNDPYQLPNPYQPFLEHAKWINFFHPGDPVSGHLDFYKVDQNIKMDFESPKWFAHSRYWKVEKMYSQIAQQYFIKKPPKRRETC